MVEHIFTMHGQRIENVYHVDAGHPATASDLVDILDVFDDWDNTWHRTQRVSNCALTLQVATALDGSGAPFLERPLTPARAGAIGGGEAFPSQVTVAVKLSTGLAGRSFRGRSFFCGLARAATSGDALNPANITAIVNIYDALRTTLAAAGFPLVVASKYSGVDVNGRPIPRVVGIMTPIITVSCEGYIDTQRRRLFRPSI